MVDIKDFIIPILFLFVACEGYDHSSKVAFSSLATVHFYSTFYWHNHYQVSDVRETHLLYFQSHAITDCSNAGSSPLFLEKGKNYQVDIFDPYATEYDKPVKTITVHIDSADCQLINLIK